MSADDIDAAAWEEVFLLMVHDLRNPVASLGANVSFLRDLGSELTGEDADVRDAVVDMDGSVQSLRRGFDHLTWIVRWLRGQPVTSVTDGDVAVAVQRMAERAEGPVRAEVQHRPLRARGGGTLPRVLEILLVNSWTHGCGDEPLLRAYRDGGDVVVEVRDGGPAVAPELREVAFTLGGQTAIKNRRDGRYGPAAGLLAARALMDAMGGSIEVGGQDGQAWFRLRLVSL